MSTSRTIVRMAASAAAGGFSAAAGGAWIGYLYESLLDGPFIYIPALNEIAFGLCFGICGLAMGIVVGAAKLGKVSSMALGFALGAACVICWVMFVIAVIKRPDRVVLLGAIPNLVVAGLLSAIVCAAISDRRATLARRDPNDCHDTHRDSRGA
jgi:hypothetical protein